MENYKMEKIMSLNKQEFNCFIKDGSDTEVKKILGIPQDKSYGIGDSTVKTNMITSPRDVLKMNFMGEDRYYIVITPLNEELALCYTVYPR